MDFVSGWDPLGVGHARAVSPKRADWVAANGVDGSGRYYDLFALRDASWSWPSDRLDGKPAAERQAILDREWNRRRWPVDGPPRAAASAFGGACLLRRARTRPSLEWSGGADGQRCEHWGVRGRGGVIDPGWLIRYE